MTVQPLAPNGTGPSTRTAADLLADPAALADASRAYGAVLGTDRLPVASALYFKAWTWAPIDLAVNRWLRERRVVDLSADQVVINTTTDEDEWLSLDVLDEHLTVLPDDPLAGQPGVTVVPDDDALLAALKRTLVDGHLALAVRGFAAVRRGGERPLWGTVAQSLCYPAAVADPLLLPDRQARVAQLLTLVPDHAARLVEVAETDEGRGWRPMLLRKTCCYAYTLPGCGECTTCCLLTDEQRDEVVAAHGATWRRP
jgi:hypothetical protein